MPIYRKYTIKDSDHFVASEFMELQTSIRHVISQLPIDPHDCTTDMILSFVKEHSINSRQVEDHPELANRISSGSLSLQVMEELFEASRRNPLFRKQLEEYIRTCIDNFRLRL
jgi:hypothetical protein